MEMSSVALYHVSQHHAETLCGSQENAVQDVRDASLIPSHMLKVMCSLLPMTPVSAVHVQQGKFHVITWIDDVLLQNVVTQAKAKDSAAQAVKCVILNAPYIPMDRYSSLLDMDHVFGVAV